MALYLNQQINKQTTEMETRREINTRAINFMLNWNTSTLKY